uniref:Protein NATD1 n=1 Tax=Timema tahoe TaxID=61484 RepID=A0A7R9FKF3_9NEOP|nr:unnamed protein product [Timema tahoe]
MLLRSSKLLSCAAKSSTEVCLTQISQFSSENFPVHHDKGASQFYVKIGKDKATIQYEKLNGTLDLQHTDVPEVFQGKGIGKILAKVAQSFEIELVDLWVEEMTQEMMKCTMDDRDLKAKILYYCREKYYHAMQTMSLDGVRKFPTDASFKLYNGLSLVLEKKVQEGIRELSPLQTDTDVVLGAVLALMTAHR